MPQPVVKVDIDSLDAAITMLQTHLDSGQIASFVDVLEAMKQQPEDPSLLARMTEEFERLGPEQGAILTYAPYISLLMSEDPFEAF
jgi:hypothetical protein